MFLFSGEEAKNIWLRLRGGYRDARRRHKKSYVSGAPQQHLKPWRYQNQMSFLEPFMSCGPRVGNLVDDSDDETQLLSQPAENPQFEVQGETLNCGENDASRELNLDETGVSIHEQDDVIEQPPSPKQYAPSQKKKQMAVQDILMRSMTQREERAQQRLEERRKLLEESQTSSDPMFNFFMSMYQLAKNMPSHYQHRIRNTVFQAVSEAEAEIMNLNQPPSTSSFQSSTPTPTYLTPLLSPHSSNSQSLLSTHQDQTAQSHKDLLNEPGQHSFSLTNFISNYQCE